MKYKFGWCATIMTLAIGGGIASNSGRLQAGTIYQWYNLGPRAIVQKLGWNNDILNYNTATYSGRVTALAIDPANPNHWLLGAAQGGVWETSDAGGSWNPRTDDQASMAMGAVAFAPGKPTLVYAGTGESNFRGDDYAGAGLLESQDGGTHWQMLNPSFAKTSFSHIVVDPLNSQSLVAATTRGGAGIRDAATGDVLLTGAPPRGIYVSADGGTNFMRALTGEATALVANPQNFNDQYAGLGEIYGDPTNGVYRTTDNWQSWSLISGPWITNAYIYSQIPIATNIQVFCTNSICYTNFLVVYTNAVTGTNISAGGRIAMAISPTAPNVLYVGLAGLRTRYTSPLEGIWVTTNAWAANPTWTQITTVFTPAVDSDGKWTPRFWYYFDLLVDPSDPFTVYLAEFDVWKYSAGTWTDVGNWGVNVHPDNHVMAWVPRANQTYQMLLGNDGGVYLSDVGVTGYWTSLNQDLRITQFYKGAVDPTGQNMLALGGAQDEFTEAFTGDPGWNYILGGDGGDCAIASGNPLGHWIVSYDTQSDSDYGNNEVNIFTTGLNQPNSYWAGSGINDSLAGSKQFYIHFEKAPQNDNLVIAGTARLWRCTTMFSNPSWTANSPTMSDATGLPVPISAMAFAPSDPNGAVYAYGTEDGQLRITYSAGQNWSNPDPNNVLPNRYVSGFAFSPADPNTLYVSFSGFDEDTAAQPGHLFKTSNALSGSPTWTDVSPPVNLPNNCVAIDPANAASVFVGTDQGVWQSGNGGGNWTHFGPVNGMPNVAVYDLRFNANSQITAFTHGRGAYLLSKINIPYIVGVKPPFHPIFGCLTCPPDWAWLNPGDQVSIPIALQNILPIDTVDLKATLLPTASISPITMLKDYGVLPSQGPAVSREFQFVANLAAPGGAGLSCGDTVQVVLQLSDQGVDLGQVSLPFRLGAPRHPLVEDFENGFTGWTSGATGSAVAWETTTNLPPNLPGAGEDDFAAPPATNTSAFVADTLGRGESYLISPPCSVATAQAQLSFQQAFDVLNPFDGGVLEIAWGSLPFQEITQAGGTFIQGGYNTVLSDRNPLGPRPAWSGNSVGWQPVVVNLPAAAAGQMVRLRWDFGATIGLTNGGWFVDSVLITEPGCLPPVSNPVILNPQPSGTQFTFEINTVSNRNYLIEWTTNLSHSAWQTLEVLPGNGTQQVVTVPIGPDKQRFYRFVVE